MNHICLDGTMLPADQPALLVTNRGYRYGDGIFETMRVKSGRILLEEFHFDRLFGSLQKLDYEQPSFFTRDYLSDKVLRLCEKNECAGSARVRLSVSRGNGDLADAGGLQYLVECRAIGTQIEQLNQEGFLIDLYPGAKKHYDQFSSIKSANYLPYLMAALYAKRKKLDDALVLNPNDRIADASVANIFYVKNDRLFTPALEEGCIAGVMRRWLIDEFHAMETKVTLENLSDADEVFLSNAMYGVRWVRQFQKKSYSNARVLTIHDQLRKAIWS